MRKTQIYILRLLVDSKLPAHLQGVLADVGESPQHYNFQGGQALLELLLSLSNSTAHTLELSRPPEDVSNYPT